MRLCSVLATTAVALSLSGCGSQEPQVEATPVARPVKTIVVGAAEGSGVRSFPGRIAAADRAEVAFRVEGKLVEIAVKEGEQVTTGQVLARLDPTDYETVVKDRQATYDAASANYARSKSLVAQGNISRMDFERIEANYKSAEAALALARQDLENTVLKAPFDGRVARRLKQNFEEVQPKEPVISLRNIAELEVKVDIPEALMLRVRRADAGETQQERTQKVPTHAFFEAAPGRRFPVSFKEVAAQADPQTQTFEVTLSMPAPEGLNVLPGMTATVTFDLSRVMGTDEVYYLPAAAVVADTGLKPQVWVVDEAAMTVGPRPVEVGRMRGAEIAVTDGLEPGDRIVVAGVPFLVEGMSVTLMPATEQAVPRTSETPAS